ncbi:MFS transporter [Pantoea agglomerans]|uniref:MFS transporter n=1 Tax=Enterobacter agglomerans TaxID=549 RepID=UPI0013B7A519|nr:MFS transporter [Pantoea agglomerans]NEG57170.1 MFS transporter [Pantoea agglomerans]NEG97806.1 MFS transporter [Pantoea agglomerans]NEH03274.1 MFS transporter [Pantoea agglomerans]NEH13495.1 MFS transporter [Pantoea agglomerans]
MTCTTGKARDPEADSPPAAIPVLSSRMIFLFSLTSALAVANVYSAQPLLESIAASLQVSPGTIGTVVTATQSGYALGLIFLVPLGDCVNRKKLVITQLLLSVLALITAAVAPDLMTLLCAMLLVGLMAVVTQLMVAWAAMLASPEQRGQVVGSVTSGIVIGILLARFVSGMIADLAGWRAVYLTAACLLLLISFILAKVLPATAGQTQRTSYPHLLLSVFRLFLTEPQLRRRGILALLIFAAFSMLWSSMVLPLTALSLSHTQTGMFGLAGIAGALAASRAGAWADLGLGQRATGLALALLTFSWLPIAALHTSLLLLIFGVILLDFAVQTVHVINQSLIVAARPEAASRLVGAYMCFYSLGSALGAIAATQLYMHWGWHAVCYAGAAVSVSAFLCWSGVRHS